MVGPLRVEGAFGVFADHLLHLELPDLSDQRRETTVAFVCGRADQVPSPLKLGVTMLAVGLGAAQRIVGVERTTGMLRHSTLPFVGELARMVRSLGFAYIWETWPDTSPTGAAS